MTDKATVVTVSERQRLVLERLARTRTLAQRLAERCRIVLGSAEGQPNIEQADVLDVDRQRVRRWRGRWAMAEVALVSAEAEGASEADLEAKIVEVLSDEDRSGTPAKFTPEQVVALVALACEPPADSARPISHWTPPELASEAIKRGIVESISPRQVDRFLGEADVRPHKSEYWLTSKDKLEAPEIYDAAVQALCETYLSAPALEAQGTHVVSTDEKTGMQALERIHPSKPVRPGTPERIEFEYVRHGTLCLIATWDVARGGILARTLGPTRTEEDFARHIAKTIDTDADAGWIFVSDQLNTHMSEALVKLVAERCTVGGDLGVKGECGALHTMATRKAFLAEASHRIRFVYTPRHSSWLNQIELWFSVLARKLLRRSSFSSLADLQARVEKFVDYFNAVLAKPFRWTFTGRALQA